MVAKKSSTYDVSHKKSTPRKQKIFRVQTTRLTVSFDTSTRSVNWTGAEIFLHKGTCNPPVFLQTAWINPDVKVVGCLTFQWKMILALRATWHFNKTGSLVFTMAAVHEVAYLHFICCFCASILLLKHIVMLGLIDLNQWFKFEKWK